MDTADLVDDAGVATVAELVADIAFDAATLPDRFAFDSGTAGGNPNIEPEEGTHEEVRVGLVPVVRSSGDGMLVARVSPDTAAAEAGLQPGDRITRWGGTPVDSVETWMGLLETHKPGDRVTVEYTRAGQTHTAEIILRGPDDDE
jgi:S1-C subfamily serine protease